MTDKFQAAPSVLPSLCCVNRPARATIKEKCHRPRQSILGGDVRQVEGILQV
jgi:hypothetical protein